jgi:alpha-tubulin suppressor-like RCC1 family protein
MYKIHTLPAALALLMSLGCQDDAPTTPSEPGAAPAIPASITASLPFRAVSTGAYHTCGVTTSNVAYCWGYNGFGALGDGSTTNHNRPVPVAGGLAFNQVSVGLDHTCGVTTGDVAYCWGRNADGQLGIGNKTGPATCFTSACSTQPVAVAGGLAFREVSAGLVHTCGLTERTPGGSRAYCWGQNPHGQLGDGTTTERLAPRAVGSGRDVWLFAVISAGDGHSCGVTSSNLAYCWGDNVAGDLGDGTTSQRLTPVAVAGGLAFRAVSAGTYYTCGLTTSARAYCWGDNQFGELGDGTTTPRLTPHPVGGGREIWSFASLSSGNVHSCGVTASFVAYCWGLNLYGSLGSGSSTGPEDCGGYDCSTRPLLVTGQPALRQVSASHGYGFTCGVSTNALGYCWGNNVDGQLGDGTFTQRLAPTAVASP